MENDSIDLMTEVITFLSTQIIDFNRMGVLTTFIKNDLNMELPLCMLIDFFNRIPYIDHNSAVLILETLHSKYKKCIIDSNIIEIIPFHLILCYSDTDRIILAKIAVELYTSFKMYDGVFKIIKGDHFIKKSPNDMLIFILKKVPFEELLEVALMIRKLLKENISFDDFLQINSDTIKNNSNLFNEKYFSLAEIIFDGDIRIFDIFGKNYNNKNVLKHVTEIITSIGPNEVFINCFKSISNSIILCNNKKMILPMIERCLSINSIESTNTVIGIIQNMSNFSFNQNEIWILPFLKDHIIEEEFSDLICSIIISFIDKNKVAVEFDDGSDFEEIFKEFDELSDKQLMFLDWLKKEE